MAPRGRGGSDRDPERKLERLAAGALVLTAAKLAELGRSLKAWETTPPPLRSMAAPARFPGPPPFA
jgi:hypothetical protein